MPPVVVAEVLPIIPPLNAVDMFVYGCPAPVIGIFPRAVVIVPMRVVIAV
jgi:hypothetical protein